MSLSAGPARIHLVSSDTWRNLEREFASNGDVALIQRGLTAAIDETMAHAYAASIQPVLPKGAALLAVGEYGRVQLFPHSGLSVLIVVETENSWTALRDLLSEFVRELWDLGLRVNHSVRTVAECLDLREEDPNLRIDLLDRRLVAGDAALFSQLENRWPAFLAKNGRKIAQDLCRAGRLRHARYQNTIRQIQPDVVENPGGLSDLKLISWLLRLGSARPLKLDPLAEASAFLSATRCFLHYRAHADRNLLDFEAQAAAAYELWWQRSSRVEWMREYYARAAAISNHARRAIDDSEKTDSSLLGNFREWRSRLSNTDFTVSRDRVLLRNPAQIETDPDLLLGLVEFMARH